MGLFEAKAIALRQLFEATAFDTLLLSYHGDVHQTCQVVFPFFFFFWGGGWFWGEGNWLNFLLRGTAKIHDKLGTLMCVLSFFQVQKVVAFVVVYPP